MKSLALTCQALELSEPVSLTAAAPVAPSADAGLTPVLAVAELGSLASMFLSDFPRPIAIKSTNYSSSIMQLRLTLAAIVLSSVACAANNPSPAPTYGARVSGQVVTPEDVRAATSVKDGEAPDVQKATLISLVDRLLILQEFERRKFAIPEQFVEERIASIVKKEFGGDRATLEETLRKQGSSIAALRRRERDHLAIETLKSQATKTAVGQDAKEQAVKEWLAVLRLKASIDIP